MKDIAFLPILIILVVLYFFLSSSPLPSAESITCTDFRHVAEEYTFDNEKTNLLGYVQISQMTVLNNNYCAFEYENKNIFVFDKEGKRVNDNYILSKTIGSFLTSERLRNNENLKNFEEIYSELRGLSQSNKNMNDFRKIIRSVIDIVPKSLTKPFVPEEISITSTIDKISNYKNFGEIRDDFNSFERLIVDISSVKAGFLNYDSDIIEFYKSIETNKAVLQSIDNKLNLGLSNKFDSMHLDTIQNTVNIETNNKIAEITQRIAQKRSDSINEKSKLDNSTSLFCKEIKNAIGKEISTTEVESYKNKYKDLKNSIPNVWLIDEEKFNTYIQQNRNIVSDSDNQRTNLMNRYRNLLNKSGFSGISAWFDSTVWGIQNNC